MDWKALRWLWVLLQIVGAAGCATASLTRTYEQEAAAATTYPLPAKSILPRLEELLSSQGYSWTGSPATPCWKTVWRCRGSICDRLIVTLVVSPSGTKVELDRLTQEGGSDDAFVHQSAAGDIEWALYEKLDPEGARRAAAQARERAERESPCGTTP